MLSERLQELVEKGLVAKSRLAGEPAADVYALTSRGQSLKAPLAALYQWGLRHAEEFEVEVEEPLGLECLGH